MASRRSGVRADSTGLTGPGVERTGGRDVKTQRIGRTHRCVLGVFASYYRRGPVR